MSSSSAGILAALRKAHEDRVKEPNAVITVAKKLLRAIEDVKNNPENNLEKMIAKPIITKLHSFSIQAMLAKEGPVSLPGTNLPDTAPLDRHADGTRKWCRLRVRRPPATQSLITKAVLKLSWLL